MSIADTIPGTRPAGPDVTRRAVSELSLVAGYLRGHTKPEVDQFVASRITLLLRQP